MISALEWFVDISRRNLPSYSTRSLITWLPMERPVRPRTRFSKRSWLIIFLHSENELVCRDEMDLII